ncbi:YfbU family protein [Dongshaea marina]|uniref:YfbU family protein n=1 Tax=Dongshaea marina TaxID=2047966 RepID=UPI000D3E8C27|nr:YfbU family protein [Dongshaea marina]
MNMTHAQRLILSNQYEIMMKLDPERSSYYKRCQTIVKRGYELQMQELELEFGQISEETCLEVIDTMEMHHAMMVSYENMCQADQDDLSVERLKFIGYCRRDERELADYCCFLLDVDKRFPTLKICCKDMNSEVALRDKYQRMLAVWKECPRQYKLSLQELRNILNA